MTPSLSGIRPPGAGRAPTHQRLARTALLRPDPATAGRFAEHIARHMQDHGRRLDHRTLEECYSPVHFEASTHH